MREYAAAEDKLAQIIYDAMPQQTVGTMRRKTWAEYENQDTYYRKVARVVLDSYVADAVAQAVAEERTELDAYLRKMERIWTDEKAQAVATERERCVQIVTTWTRQYPPSIDVDLAAALRAPGQP